MTSQDKLVGEFFDRIANKYDSKYKAYENMFLAHFFKTRLEMATNGLPKTLGTVVDIGAGTGQLYRFLLENGYSFDDYVAVDVSEGMLFNSAIPEEKRHIGTVHIPALDCYEGKVDHVFMLGVTTYMSATEVEEALDRIKRLSAKDGQLVCTFTNRYSVEFFMQAAISSLLRAFRKLSGNRLNLVAAQTFPRLIVGEKRMKAFLLPCGAIERIDYLNQTVTPLNRLFTRASIRLESLLNRILPRRPGILAAFSSDILFRVRFGGR